MKNGIFSLTTTLFSVAHSQVAADCFSQSSSASGLTQGEPFTQLTDLQSEQFTKTMRLEAIKACVSSVRRVTGISVMYQDRIDESNTLILPPIGDATGWCTTFRLRSAEDYIKTIEISYDQKGLTHIAIISTEEVVFFGEQTRVLNS